MRRLPLTVPLLCLAWSFPALAQATRTWVSGVGDDANPCSRTAPCKTFAGAISRTAAAGEIDVLDPGGFGAVTITKSLTIDGHHTLAGVLVGATNAITVNAAATDVVTLRGLDFMAAGAALSGVKVISAKAVHVEESVITGFAIGIEVQAPAAGVAPPQLFVRDCTMRDSTTADVVLSGAQAVLDRVRLVGSPLGLDAKTTSKVTAHDVVIAGHATAGVSAEDTSDVNLEHGVVSGNGTGVLAATGATVRLSDVMVSHNATGVSGPVSSFGNNRLAAGNTATGTPSATLQQQ